MLSLLQSGLGCSSSWSGDLESNSKLFSHHTPKLKMEEKKKITTIKTAIWKWGEWEMSRNPWSITIAITLWAGIVMSPFLNREVSSLVRPSGSLSFSFLPIPLSVNPGFTLWKVLPYSASSWPHLKWGTIFLACNICVLVAHCWPKLTLSTPFQDRAVN